MATIEMLLTADEIQKNIPYQLICQTRYGSIWNTMRRKLKWNDEFTDDEKLKAERLFSQAHSWSVGKGIPNTVRMNLTEYALWDKIGRFCCEL